MINTGNLKAMKERKTVVGRIRLHQKKKKEDVRSKRLMWFSEGIVLHFGIGAYSLSFLK